MPYNTRRVSLSLPSLGIHLPGTSNASRKSPPQPVSSSSTSQTSSAGTTGPNVKRVKRAHTNDFTPAPPARRRKSSVVAPQLNKQYGGDAVFPGRVSEQTPPPSPFDFQAKVIDKEGINDDIVVAVLEQLEATGNRPHQIKELAALLINRLTSVGS